MRLSTRGVTGYVRWRMKNNGRLRWKNTVVKSWVNAEEKVLRNEYGNHVFITGASSGIGRACAVALAKRGFQVIGVSRSCNEGEKRYKSGGSICMFKMDVTDEKSIERVFEKIAQVDIAILAAGSGYAGAIAEAPVSYARKQMEVNYFGVLNVCSRILPLMHEKKNGLVIVIGSVAGKVSIPMQSQYSASKYALEAYVDALRLEAEPYGIKACIVEPGDTKTGFTDGRNTFIKEGSIYEAAVRNAVGKMEEDERNGDRPEKAAGVVLRLIGKKNPPARIAVGAPYKLAMALIKHLPDKARENVIRKMYLSGK